METDTGENRKVHTGGFRQYGGIVEDVTDTHLFLQYTFKDTFFLEDVTDTHLFLKWEIVVTWVTEK
jgi:hypothetical protein